MSTPGVESWVPLLPELLLPAEVPVHVRRSLRPREVTEPPAHGEGVCVVRAVEQESLQVPERRGPSVRLQPMPSFVHPQGTQGSRVVGSPRQ